MTLLKKFREKIGSGRGKDFMQYETSSFHQMKISPSISLSEKYSHTSESSIGSHEGNHCTTPLLQQSPPAPTYCSSAISELDSIGSLPVPSIRSTHNKSLDDISAILFGESVGSPHGNSEDFLSYFIKSEPSPPIENTANSRTELDGLLPSASTFEQKQTGPFDEEQLCGYGEKQRSNVQDEYKEHMENSDNKNQREIREQNPKQNFSNIKIIRTSNYKIEERKNQKRSNRPSNSRSSRKSHVRRIKHPILSPNSIPTESKNPSKLTQVRQDQETVSSSEHQTSLSKNSTMQSEETPTSKLEAPAIDTSSALSSLICLNLLNPDLEDRKGQEQGRVVPHQQNRRTCSQIVHDSFKQHVRNRLIPVSKNKLNKRTLRSLPVDCDNVTFVSEDLNQISSVALDHLSCFQYKEAVDIFRVVLKDQRSQCLLLLQEQQGQQQKLNRSNSSSSTVSSNCRDSTSSIDSANSNKRSTVCHLQLAETLRKLSILNLHVGRTNDAMGYCRDALKIHRSWNRPIHTALGLMDVGMILFGDNDLSSSLQVWREALQMACMTIGYDHPFVAILLNNIGCLHYQNNDYHPSLRALEESLGLQRKMLSTSCSSTDRNYIDDVEINSNVDLALYNIAVTMGNIAMIFIQNKDYKSALSMLEEALPIQESIVVSTNHPVIQSTLDHMEYANQLQKAETEAAEKLSHIPSSTTTLMVPMDDNKATAIPSIFGDNADGIPIRSSGAGISLVASKHGADNSDYLLLGSLARDTTAHQRVLASLEEACDRAANEFWQQKVSDGPRVRVSSSGLFSSAKPLSIPIDIDAGDVMDAELHLEDIQFRAMEYIFRNEMKDALELFECSTNSHREKYGDIHHLVGTGLHNSGIVHMLAGEYVQANFCFQEALDVRTAALGPDHPDVAASMFKIALIQTACGEFESALATFADILMQRHLAKEVIQAEEAKILNNMGVVFYEMGNDTEALRSFFRAHEIQSKILEAQNVAKNSTTELAAANSLSNLGFINAKKHRYNEAFTQFQEALNIRRKYLNAFDPAITTLEENIAHVKAFGANTQANENTGRPIGQQYIRYRLSCSNPFQQW